MRRRDWLALLGGLAGGLAGCMDAPLSGQEPTASPSPTAETPSSGPTRSPTPTPIRESIGGVDLPVPRSELLAALPKDHIPALIDPVFAEDWADLEVPDSSGYDGGPLLPDDAPVIGVERDERARAYPLRILDWHEVVNDTLGGPLLVTYCPLCGSGVTAERRVNGSETRFGVSGLLWRDNLVMYDDRTGSLWSQLLGGAIRGPRAGEQLSLLHSSLTSWGEWRGLHPSTEVLLPPPHSNTVRGPDATFDYFAPKYSYDEEEQLIGFDHDAGDDGLHPRTLVIGVTADGIARAYPFNVVKTQDVINDRVGDLAVVVSITPARTLVAYQREVDGSVLAFSPADAEHMQADGSRWERATGRAVDGPHEGTTLEAATESGPLFWRGWSNLHPETEVYG
ncbi:MAG: DUF3179 domain-containing protein [Halobacteriales archaeon]